MHSLHGGQGRPNVRNHGRKFVGSLRVTRTSKPAHVVSSSPISQSSLAPATITVPGGVPFAPITTVLQASSLFDAADRALQQWARLWWVSPGAV
jgi:hypothetical protein